VEATSPRRREEKSVCFETATSGRAWFLGGCLCSFEPDMMSLWSQQMLVFIDWQRHGLSDVEARLKGNRAAIGRWIANEPQSGSPTTTSQWSDGQKGQRTRDAREKNLRGKGPEGNKGRLDGETSPLALFNKNDVKDATRTVLCDVFKEVTRSQDWNCFPFCITPNAHLPLHTTPAVARPREKRPAETVKKVTGGWQAQVGISVPDLILSGGRPGGKCRKNKHELFTDWRPNNRRLVLPRTVCFAWGRGLREIVLTGACSKASLHAGTGAENGSRADLVSDATV
ncbi:hypothetical protein BaRGS_00017178, partial [Batillaria attramentaria]